MYDHNSSSIRRSPYVAAGFDEHSVFVVNRRIKFAELIDIGEKVKLHFDDHTHSPRFIAIDSNRTFYSEFPMKDINDVSHELRYIGDDVDELIETPASFGKSVFGLISEYHDMIGRRIDARDAASKRVAEKVDYMRKVHMSAKEIAAGIDISDINFQIDVFKEVIKIFKYIKDNSGGNDK